ncbi:nicotinate-nucleotide adenylyltransferase [Halobacillus campisalis]|uniref:Probable nicotinate-nucleotide adenylyltransferase n=1 Tax=Halobacillus campisalis TaxID=435909 RepID=A0ABW2K4B1_9BACI|nr:nicotinate-nucleotide adenylyltransferase [Halobacillus campisalis]
MKRIGLLGGTFDPPHLGHMIIAEHIRENLELDEVWFIPSHLPPHKQEAAVSAEDRLQMVKKATEGNPHFSVSEIELNREGKSYTIDTMKSLLKEYPSDEFCFIIGGDMVQYLDRWHKIEELNELVQFVGVGREGIALDSHFNVKMVEIPRIDISSSMIRQRLTDKKSIRYLIPEGVFHFIKENALYEFKP